MIDCFCLVSVDFSFSYPQNTHKFEKNNINEAKTIQSMFVIF